MSETSSPPPRQAPVLDLLAVAGLAAAVFTYAHLPALNSPFVINDDVRQQIYWMQQWQDPGLYPGDLLTAYARQYVSWGVKALYWLAAFFISPLWFSKILTGLLFVWLSCLLFRLGASLGGRPLAWTVAAVSWLMPFFLENLSGGLARAFALPLLAWFWLAWLNGKPISLALALLAQAIFIPYIFPVAAGALILAWFSARFTSIPPPPFPKHLGHFCIIAAAAALVYLFNLNLSQAGFGPLVSAAGLAARPEFGPQGRYAIFPVPRVFWEFLVPWGSLAPLPELGPVLGGLAIAGQLSLAAWGAVRLGREKSLAGLASFGFILLSSLACFILARLFLLKLFVPNRYLIYTLMLGYVVILSRLWLAPFQSRVWPRRLPALLVIFAAILGSARLQGTEIFDYSMYRPLYAALAQTPKDALIAGHPNLMDNVLTFGKRPVFASFELAHPWSQGYWEKVQPRLEELFTAYYATDPEIIKQFCRKYRIDFLVVDDRHFTAAFLAGGRLRVPFDDPPPQPSLPLREKVACPFFAPFDAQIRRLTQGHAQFALLSRELFPGLDLDPHQRLIDMRELGGKGHSIGHTGPTP